MNLSFQLVRLKVGRKAKIYTIQYNGEENHEFHKFITKSEVKNHTDFQALRKKIKELYDKRGLLPQYFRPEDDSFIHDEICRIDYGHGCLRLYCIRWDDNLLILGGGGIKSSNIRFWQDDPILTIEVRKVIDAFHELNRYLDESGLTIDSLL